MTEEFFDPAEFHRLLRKYRMRTFILLSVPLLLLLLFFVYGKVSQETVLGLPLWNAGGGPTLFGLPIGIIAVATGVGAIGLFSFGPLAIGFFAYGGGAFGAIAVGGGAIGLFAFGGISFGLVAVGGNAAGYIAVGGGGAFGNYVIAGKGKGRYVIDDKHQDKEAVRFFCRYLPRLRMAFSEQRRM